MDTTSLKSDFVNVDGVRLHYLDWGGSGEVLLLLPGFGDEASVFDGFAQKFTHRFHVIGLTRRGYGESDRPATGYDLATRVEDIRHLLDITKIEKATFIGHSMAGDEITLFASLYPTRVNKLVYLDAAHDRRRTADITLSDPTCPPYYRRLLLEVTESPEAALIMVDDMPSLAEWERSKAMMKAMITFPTDFTRVQAPALAFFAMAKHHPYVPPQATEEIQEHMNDWWINNAIPYVQACVEKFINETEHGEVVVMKEADHYLFLGDTQEVVLNRIHKFLLNESGG
jgi:pimeloyl-ACP methyl ester carboxylesterase